MKSKLLFILFLTTTWMGCTPSDHSESTKPVLKKSIDEYAVYAAKYNLLPDNKATQVLKKAIEKCGGWQKYTSIQGIDYVKTIIKFDSTGQPYDTVVQQHQYNVFPSYKVKMEWTEKQNDHYRIINNGQQSWKYKRGKLMQDQKSINSAYNSSHGSQYVLFQPWKLADPAAQIEYDGQKKLPNGKIADVLKMTYSDKNSTTTEHTWWYYFDIETGLPFGNFLKSPQGYSYTEYMAFQEFGGLEFHVRRKSYKSDALMNNLQLSTIYINEEIKLVKSFPNQLFNG